MDHTNSYPAIFFGAMCFIVLLYSPRVSKYTRCGLKADAVLCFIEPVLGFVSLKFHAVPFVTTK